MSTATHSPSSATLPAAPYRKRKPAMRLDGVLIARAQPTGPRLSPKQRWPSTARVLEEEGEDCKLLAPLAQESDATQPPSAATAEKLFDELRSLMKEAACLASRIGAQERDSALRSVCFTFAWACQHASVQIRNHQLWRVK